MIRAVTGLAHSLGTTVTAEGIERGTSSSSSAPSAATRARATSSRGRSRRTGFPSSSRASAPTNGTDSGSADPARLARTLVVRLIGIPAFTGAL